MIFILFLKLLIYLSLALDTYKIALLIYYFFLILI